MKKYTIELTEEERDLLLEILTHAREQERIVEAPVCEVRKTIMDWLRELKSPEIREKALEWCDPNSTEVKVPSLYDALISAFEWDKTPEGFDYWRAIANNLRDTTK